MHWLKIGAAQIRAELRSSRVRICPRSSRACAIVVTEALSRSVSVSAGEKLPFISRAGDKVRVCYYDGADYDIPMSATDLK